MAQNITIAGASYSGVPAVSLNKAGGGTATFVDPSDATASAGDIVSGKTAYVRKSDLTTHKKNDPVTPAKGTAKEMDWWKSDIRKIFSTGTTATITDVETGLAWREVRMGGTNHADCQPVSASDTATLKKIYGSWSWDRRAIFVTIDGVNYAASMNGMPHGSDGLSGNDFDGHHCIHFTNSRTHSSNKVDADHQKMIAKAAKAKLK